MEPTTYCTPHICPTRAECWASRSPCLRSVAPPGQSECTCVNILQRRGTYCVAWRPPAPSNANDKTRSVPDVLSKTQKMETTPPIRPWKSTAIPSFWVLLWKHAHGTVAGFGFSSLTFWNLWSCPSWQTARTLSEGRPRVQPSVIQGAENKTGAGYTKKSIELPAKQQHTGKIVSFLRAYIARRTNKSGKRTLDVDKQTIEDRFLHIRNETSPDFTKGGGSREPFGAFYGELRGWTGRRMVARTPLPFTPLNPARAAARAAAATPALCKGAQTQARKGAPTAATSTLNISDLCRPRAASMWIEHWYMIDFKKRTRAGRGHRRFRTTAHPARGWWPGHPPPRLPPFSPAPCAGRTRNRRSQILNGGDFNREYTFSAKGGGDRRELNESEVREAAKHHKTGPGHCGAYISDLGTHRALKKNGFQSLTAPAPAGAASPPAPAPAPPAAADPAPSPSGGRNG
eukprot:gene8914-biopygen16677